MLINKQPILEYLEKIGECITAEAVDFKCIYSDDREIYQITCNNKRYIYKTIGTDRKSLDEFEIEFNLMDRIWKSSKGTVLMPEPLLLVDGVGFLMTECAGMTLKEVYFSSLLNYSKRNLVKKSMVMSARWLSDFHSTTLVNDSYSDSFRNRKEHLIRMTDSIIEKSDKKVTNLMKELVLLFDKYNNVNKTDLCQLHGNFALRNILFDDINISLIDFEDSKFDTIYYDLGMFIAELNNKSVFVFNSMFNNVLIKLFVNGYNKKITINNYMLNSYVLYHLVSSYYEVVNRARPNSLSKRSFLAYKKYHNLVLIKRVVKLLN